jgi:thioredoxin-related protein
MFKLPILAALAAATVSPSTPDPVAGHPPTGAANVDWVYSLPAAIEKAKAEDRMILAYFWADGSEYCGKLYQETLSAADSGAALERFVCVSARHGEEGMQELFERFRVNTLPTMLFLDTDGTPEDLIQGFIPVEDFLGELDRIERGEGTISGMRTEISKAKKNSEEDMGTRMGLAGKLIEVGDEAAHDEILDSIRDDDPRGRTLTGSRLLLSDLEEYIAETGGGEEYRDNWDLEPLYSHAKAMRLKEARFEAWNRIANLEVYKMNMPAAFDAFQTAWKLIPEEQAHDWSGSVASWIIENADQRTTLEKKFALDLATANHKLMEEYISEQDGEPSEEQNGYLASSMNRLAWAYYINGKGPKAVATARRSLKLHDSEKYRADLATFTRGR